MNKARKVLPEPLLKRIDGGIDGLYLANSLVRFVTDCSTDSAAEANLLQQKFYHGSNLPLALLEMALLTGYGILAKRKQNSDNSWLVSAAISSWPYFRDFLSGLKNGRHAVVNVGGLFHCANLGLCNPIGILVGIAYAGILVNHRRMQQQRERLIQQNLNAEPEQIQSHSLWQCQLNYLAAGIDGLTDGLYLYGYFMLLISLGVTSLASGTPFLVALITMTVISSLSIFSKLHDEYLQQQRLVNSTKVRPNNTDHSVSTAPNNTFYANSSLCFQVWRAMLCGIKNARAAIGSIALCVDGAAYQVFFSVLANVVGVCYAGYLSYQTWQNRPSLLKATPKNPPDDASEPAIVETNDRLETSPPLVA